MKIRAISLGVASVVALAGVHATFCAAAPLQPKVVSAKAIWVLHLDVDALTATPLWHSLQGMLLKNSRLQARLREIQTVSGMKFPQDMHDITVYGTAFKPRDGVAVVHAATNQKRIVNALKTNSQYQRAQYGKFTLRHWTDHGHSRWGAYYNKNTIVIGQAKKPVERELDVLVGKSRPLAIGAPLLEGLKGDMVLYISGSELNKLPTNDARSPVIRQLRHVWMRLSDRGNSVYMRAQIVAINAAAAKKINKTIQGFQSMLELAAGPKSPPPVVWRARAVDGLTSHVAGNSVQVRWSIPNKLVEQAVRQRMAAKRHGGGGSH